MKSPCINICVIDEVCGYCIGCGRTRQEIASWTRMTPDEHDATMAQLSDRVTSITKGRKRAGGRRGRRKG